LRLRRWRLALERRRKRAARSARIKAPPKDFGKPGRQPAEVVAGGGEDGVGGVAVRSLEEVAAHAVLAISKIFSYVVGGRQGEPKRGPSSLICLCPQPTAMRVDNGSADRKPHPEPAGLCRVEGIENPLEVLNAGPRIAHRDQKAT
jgi:hypothetical protein